MSDARIPDHCGWAMRGRWKEAYDAADADLAAARAENKRLTKERDNLSKLEQSHREQANEQFHRANKAEVERDKARSMLADAERDMRQRAAVAARKTWDGYDAAAHILALPLKHADREGG